jgi:hydroxyacylglutathione hydrolase
MRELAPDVFQIPLTPRNGINAYLLGDVLIDAGVKQSAKKILKELDGRTVTAHALTHAHVDHAGGSKEITETLNIPFWVGALDAEAAATGDAVTAKPWMARFGKFPGTPVSRTLNEGDEVAGFTVLDTPGHSPGHISFWRESDRVLVCGDVFNAMNLITTAVGLRQPPGIFTPDPARNRESERRVAELEPALMLVGHGPPWRDPAAIKAFVAGL